MFTHDLIWITVIQHIDCKSLRKYSTYRGVKNKKNTCVVRNAKEKNDEIFIAV